MLAIFQFALLDELKNKDMLNEIADIKHKLELKCIKSLDIALSQLKDIVDSSDINELTLYDHYYIEALLFAKECQSHELTLNHIIHILFQHIPVKLQFIFDIKNNLYKIIKD